MTPDEQRTRGEYLSAARKVRALLFPGVLLAWSVLIFVREHMPFGSKASNPLLVKAGFRLYRLHRHTGTATAYGRWTETVKTTTTDQDPMGNTRTTYTQRTYFHERFSLTSRTGERLMRVTDAHVNPAIGHVITAVWAIRRFRKSGHYVLFFDRTQPRTVALVTTIRWLLSLRLWMFIPVIVLAIIGALIATLLLGPGTDWVFILIIVAMIVAAFLFAQTSKRRGRRFVDKDAPRILAAIEKAEPPDAGSLLTQG